MLKRLWIGVLVGLLLSVAPVLAQDDRTVYWQDWNVHIDNVDTSGNSYDVTEFYNVDFSGTFRFGSRLIPPNGLDAISNVSVFQNERPLQQSCSGSTGTYCVQSTEDGIEIRYNFFQPITNDSESFRIEYTVEGALRSYEGGDQLYWYAIPPDHYGFAIGRSEVTIELPAGFAPRPGIDNAVTYGAPTTVEVNGSTITATSTREIGGDENLEIRVQYPHDPNLAPPSWQAGYDQRRGFQETAGPILSVLSMVISLAVAIGGPLYFYTRWQRKGRDPRVGPVPEYITEPPSDLRPAVVGTLIDEQADVRDVISTLVDLGHRGYLVIEEEQKEGLFGLGHSSEFTFKRTDKAATDLRPFERRLYNDLFKGGMERSLNSLRNKFYTTIPAVQGDLYEELVAQSLFAVKPTTTRNTWMGIGLVLLIVAIGLFFASATVVELVSTVICIPLAVGVAGIAALITGPFMPAKTLKGAEETAKWRAFLNYLNNLEKYGAVEGAAARFDEFLPYAVAFGIDRSWMAKFRNIDQMPIPPWYYPTYVGGPYSRGYIPGTPLHQGFPTGNGGGISGDLARAGGGGLSMSDVSRNMATSMNNLSSGLATMMSSAAAAMTSRPQSSSSGTSGRWSGGGGSWSGGGSHGGGGSGGGSSGFG